MGSQRLHLELPPRFRAVGRQRVRPAGHIVGAGSAVSVAKTARGRIPYALVVTVESKQTRDLYDQVAPTYAGRLEALQPIIELPVRV